MDFIILKTSGTRHVVGNLITATYVTIAVARILVVSIWFSPAGDCKEKNILLYWTGKTHHHHHHHHYHYHQNCYRHQQYHCRYEKKLMYSNITKIFSLSSVRLSCLCIECENFCLFNLDGQNIWVPKQLHLYDVKSLITPFFAVLLAIDVSSDFFFNWLRI